jgi:ABC-type bacteriocin/lantibiotic exporter with double-glycine peptidase domain
MDVYEFEYDFFQHYHLEEPGIMKWQSKPWKCGPAAVRNALRAFGVKVSEDVLSKMCGTTDQGTDEYGIMDAVRGQGFVATEYRSGSKKNAWHWLHGTLGHGEVVILCTQAWEHWVVAIGTSGKDRIIIIDSSNFKYNVSENGTHVWKKSWLMYQWWNARKSVPDEEPRLYAIAVKPK